MPRRKNSGRSETLKRPKIEPAEPEKGPSITHYETYKSRLDDWRKLDKKEKLQICGHALAEGGGALSCLNEPTCTKKYVSALGAVGHMEKCGTVEDLPRGARARPTPPVMQETDETQGPQGTGGGKKRGKKPFLMPEPEEGWVGKLESYKGKLEEWRELPSKEQNMILKRILEIQETISCPNYDLCGGVYASFGGILYHLKQCSYDTQLEAEQIIQEKEPLPEYSSLTESSVDQWLALSRSEQNRILRGFFGAGNEFALCFKCGLKYTSHMGLLYHLERCSIDKARTGNWGGRLDKKEILGGKRPIDVFRSFMGRIDAWRSELSKAQHRFILKHVVSDHLKSMRCLENDCKEVLTTAEGWLYHLGRCGLSKEEQPWKCPRCGASMKAGEKDQHRNEVHRSQIEQERQAKLEESFDIPLEDIGKRRSAIKARNNMTNILPAIVKVEDDNDGDADFDAGKVEADSDEDLDDADADESAFDLRQIRSSLNKSGVRVANRKKVKIIHMKECNSKAYVKNMEAAYERFVEQEQSEHLFADWTCPVDQWTPISDCSNCLPPFTESLPLEVEQQERVFHNFESRSSGQVCALFCGGPILSCAWCPGANPHEQFIALTTANDSLITEQHGPHNLVQFWRIQDQNGELQSEFSFGLVHKYGMTLDIGWCPSGIASVPDGPNELQRLGIVALATCSGAVPLFCIPHPDGLSSTGASTSLFSPAPVAVLEPQTAIPVIEIDWCPFSPQDRIALTRADGKVLLWKLSDTEATVLNTGPTWQARVRSCRWMSRDIVAQSHERPSASVRIMNVDTLETLLSHNELRTASNRVVTAPSTIPGYVAFGFVKTSGNKLFCAVYTNPENAKGEVEVTALGNRHTSTIADCRINARTGDVFSLGQHELTLGRYGQMVPHGCYVLRRDSHVKVLMRFEQIKLQDDMCFTYEDCVGRRKLRLDTRPTAKSKGDDNSGAEFCPNTFYRLSVSQNSGERQLVCVAGHAGFAFVLDAVNVCRLQ